VKGLGFYEAAAQIIPILLIVIAFEARMFGRRELGTAERVIACAIVGLVGVGEAITLRVLMNETANDFEETMVWSALGLEAGLIGAIILTTGGVDRDRK
jgi:hypothetical protein